MSEGVENCDASLRLWISHAASYRLFLWWNMPSGPRPWIRAERQNGTSEVTRSFKAPWKLGRIGQFFSWSLPFGKSMPAATVLWLSDPVAKTRNIMKARSDIYCSWHRLKFLDSFLFGSMFDRLAFFHVSLPSDPPEIRSAFSYARTRTHTDRGCSFSVCVCVCVCVTFRHAFSYIYVTSGWCQ